MVREEGGENWEKVDKGKIGWFANKAHSSSEKDGRECKEEGQVMAQEREGGRVGERGREEEGGRAKLIRRSTGIAWFTNEAHFKELFFF